MMIEICGALYSEVDVPVALARDALAVQNASNLGGVASSFAEHVRTLHSHARYCGTDWIKHHPVVVLFLNKMDSLCTGDLGDVKAFSAAYDLCSAVVSGEK